jgi:type I restriction enzyme R subunit
MSDGRRIAVIGEILYELGPDGTTLRTRSYREYARDALHEISATATELRAQWLRQEQRDEIRSRLEEQGINLGELAAALGLPDADPLDLLLHVAFGQRALTRQERADRLLRERASFFGRYSPAAREILDMVLEKYVRGEAPDVSNPDLLRLPPISARGTFVELAGRFGSGARVRQALREMETLLYSA